MAEAREEKPMMAAEMALVNCILDMRLVVWRING